MSTAKLRPGHARRGVAALEFAVVAPLLFMLIFGIIEFGRIMMVLELVGNTAREGSRTGTLAGMDNAEVTKVVQDSLNSSSVPSTHATIKIYVNDVEADVKTAQTRDRIKVAISVPYSDVAWLPPFFVSDTLLLTQGVTMRKE